MSDEQFSVDEILNEYSKKRKETKNPQTEYDIDEFLLSSDAKRTTEVKGKKFEVHIPDEPTDSAEESASPVAVEALPKASEVIEPQEVNTEVEKTPEIEAPSESENSDIDFDLIKLIMPPKSEAAKTPKKSKPEFDETAAFSFGQSASNQTDTKPLKAIRKGAGNTEIIEGLLKLKREKVFSRTTDITPINRKKIDDIDLDIQSKIIPKTEQIPLPQGFTDDTKIQKLFERRNKKIKDFVLSSGVEDEECDDDDDDDENVDEIDDFENFDEAPAVLKDILQLKGTLIVRFCFLLIATIVSTYISVANDFNWPLIGIMNLEVQPTSFLFINIVLGLLCAFVSYTVISGGMRNFYRFNADADSICAFALISSLIASGALIINPTLLQTRQVHCYIPVAIAALLFNTLGKIFIVNRTERNFKYISSDIDKFALFQVQDENTATKFTKGALRDFPYLSSMKKTEFINDFLRTSYSADLSDNYSKYAVPITMLISLISTFICVFLNRTQDIANIIFLAFSTFAGTIAACCSFALLLVVNFPLSKASKKYIQSSACMIGYSAIEEFSDTNSVLLDLSRLFPDGMVELVNLKQLSSTSIEEGILVAASLTYHAGSILKSTFYKMLRGKTEMLYPVESYIYEDTLGLSGWIDNKRVLLGSRELMINHSIEGLPSKAKESEYAKGDSLVLYLSISGEITTMFIVQVKANPGITRWVQELERQNVTIVLRSVDAMISLYFLSELFDVAADCFKLVPFRFHKSFDEETTYVPNISSSMLCGGKFHSFAMLISGAKKLHKTAALGVSLILASAVLGVILSLVLTALSSFSQLTSSVLLLYNLAWLILILGVEAFRKS